MDDLFSVEKQNVQNIGEDVVTGFQNFLGYAFFTRFLLFSPVFAFFHLFFIKFILGKFEKSYYFILGKFEKNWCFILGKSEKSCL